MDQENGNNLWFEAIKKEMKNVRTAFREYDKDGITPDQLRKKPQLLPGFQEIKYHIILTSRWMEGSPGKQGFLLGDI